MSRKKLIQNSVYTHKSENLCLFLVTYSDLYGEENVVLNLFWNRANYSSLKELFNIGVAVAKSKSKHQKN